MRLMINDAVDLIIDGEKSVIRVVKISRRGLITLCGHNEANVDARDRDKNDPFSYLSKSPASLQKLKGRRVTISELGDLRDPGFKE